MTRRRWQVYPSLTGDALAERLRDESLFQSRGKNNSSYRLNITPLLVQLLNNRGIIDPSQFEPFLAADERLSHDPLLLPDMDKAVARIQHAISNDELIAIYGDFDADGITATVLLVQGISQLGGRTMHYIPHRLDEGHGLNFPALKSLSEQGVSLIVTVDCGITGLSEVEMGRELNLDIIITDHHVTLDTIPAAVAAIDPKRTESKYPFTELAGVGVAYKLLQALFGATQRISECEEYLDLVVLGTVADMVPLGNENRYLVKHGIEILNRSKRIGIRELVQCAGLEMGKLNEENIAFTLGPRLNSSGRIDHAVTSYDLLIASSQEQARQLASTLEANNSERQRLTAEFFEKAKEEILQGSDILPLLVVASPDYPSGVAGVVAGKLTEEFYRPVFVLRLDGEKAKGSGRSIPEFNLVGALTESQHLLTRFGGHHQAAGFVASSDNVDQLRQQLIEIASRDLEGVDLCPTLTIDAIVSLSALSGDTYKLISTLAPFGQANPEPVFLSRNVKLMDSHRVGTWGDHLKLKLRDGKVIWDAIAFDLGSQKLSSHLDIVYNLKKEEWGGRQLLQLNILDFHPSS